MFTSLKSSIADKINGDRIKITLKDLEIMRDLRVVPIMDRISNENTSNRRESSENHC